MRIRMTILKSTTAVLAACTLLAGAACTATGTRTTSRDKTAKGAGIGAAAGAVLGAVIGEGEADDILKGAAIGAGIGAGVGAYMDRQEEKLARIPGTTVKRIDEDMLEIKFDSDVLFAVDSSTVGADAKGTLDQVAAVIAEFPKTAVVVQGHTDSSGSDAYNQSLSERRADAVRAHLASRGVDSARMTAVGYGESAPVADNGTADGRARNRRVTILLKAKAK